MKNIIMFLIAVMALSVTGCKEDSPVTPPQQDHSFLPLKVGNSWTYKVYSNDEYLWDLNFVCRQLETGEFILTKDKDALYNDLPYFSIDGIEYTTRWKLENGILYLTIYNWMKGEYFGNVKLSEDESDFYDGTTAVFSITKNSVKYLEIYFERGIGIKNMKEFDQNGQKLQELVLSGYSLK